MTFFFFFFALVLKREKAPLTASVRCFTASWLICAQQTARCPDLSLAEVSSKVTQTARWIVSALPDEPITGLTDSFRSRMVVDSDQNAQHEGYLQLFDLIRIRPKIFVMLIVEISCLVNLRQGDTTKESLMWLCPALMLIGRPLLIHQFDLAPALHDHMLFWRQEIWKRAPPSSQFLARFRQGHRTSKWEWQNKTTLRCSAAHCVWWKLIMSSFF